jgi:hypothetical protein
MSVFKLLAAVLALVLLAVVLQDAFEVMLLPRRIYRRARLMRYFFHASWASCAWVAGHLPKGRLREHFLGLYGPISILLLFGLWAAGLIGGFGILEWALQPHATADHAASPLSEQVYMSGVTFFTVGFGDVLPRSGAARAVAVVEGGTGIGFIAVVIGYLPVLYQLFARREAHVIMLDSRAGSPPTAATMLLRHAGADGPQALNAFLREWEVWAADLLESHLSYPMLAYYRSQHEDQSWLSALTAIMDACALILVGAEDVQPLQARMTFAMTRQVLIEMARFFEVEPSRYSGGTRLPHQTYLQMEVSFAEAGMRWRVGDEVEATLATLRATYEPLVHSLAAHLRLLPLPGWVPEKEGPADHWSQGPRGMIAQRLIEELSADRQPSSASREPEHKALPGARWRQLRSRLRRDI